MLDYNKTYLEHIKDSDQIAPMKKVLDKIESCVRNHTVEFTDFLDPYQIRLSESILNRFDEVRYFYEGGIESAERKCAVIYPYYLDREELENPVAALEIEGSFKFNRVSHSDYLGSIMGTGIKREKLGDIFVGADKGFIVVHKDIAPYICLNLSKIGRESVRLREVDFSEIEIPEKSFRDKVITVSSERLDSILSEIYDLPRSKGVSLIQSDKVKVNWQPVQSNSKAVYARDMISTRGFGRAEVLEDLGTSKKGKKRLNIRIYE